MLCRPQHKTGFLVTSFEECSVSTVLTAGYYWPSSHCISDQKFCVRFGRVKSQPFTVSVGLRQGRVLPPLLFIVYISGFQLFAEGSQIQIYTILLESLTQIFNTIQLTRFVLQQNEVCHTKY